MIRALNFGERFLALLGRPLHAKRSQFCRPLLFLLGRELLGVEIEIAARFVGRAVSRRQAGLQSQQRIAHLRHFVNDELEPPPEPDLANLKLCEQIFGRHDIELIALTGGDVRLTSEIEFVGGFDGQHELGVRRQSKATHENDTRPS